MNKEFYTAVEDTNSSFPNVKFSHILYKVLILLTSCFHSPACAAKTCIYRKPPVSFHYRGYFPDLKSVPASLFYSRIIFPVKLISGEDNLIM